MQNASPLPDSLLKTSPFKTLVGSQLAFFETGATRPIQFRKNQLKLLSSKLKRYEEKIFKALKTDLGKSHFESFGFEMAQVSEEIKCALSHLNQWMKPKTVHTPLVYFWAKSRIHYEPRGLSLIIAPWNYPLSLSLTPLVGSIAAGNCTVIKPSELCPHTSSVLKEIIQDTFNPDYISLVEGEAKTTQELIDCGFDHVFFTGSTEVGKIIMAASAKHLSSLTLELGGKSPCILDRNVDLKACAKRIVWGKFSNAGQTCVAPDYVLVPKEDKEALCSELVGWIQQFYGQDPKQSSDYGRIVSHRHLKRLTSLAQEGNILYGGTWEEDSKYFEPTLLDGVSLDSNLMKQEIFGPLLPLLTYDNAEEVVSIIRSLPKPLSLYLFSDRKKFRNTLLDRLSFGGGCINDTLIHVGSPYLPFGGVGASGLGKYHGRSSFEAFSNQKCMVERSLKIDFSLRYPPYRDHLKWLKRLLPIHGKQLPLSVAKK